MIDPHSPSHTKKCRRHPRAAAAPGGDDLAEGLLAALGPAPVHHQGVRSLTQAHTPSSSTAAHTAARSFSPGCARAASPRRERKARRRDPRAREGERIPNTLACAWPTIWCPLSETCANAVQGSAKSASAVEADLSGAISPSSSDDDLVE